jgi:hypothetical protein
MSPAVTVEVRDRYGNRVLTSTGSVLLELVNPPSNATLLGRGAINAVSGLATFGALSLDKAAEGYTLKATSGSLAVAISSAFDVRAGPASALFSTLVPSAVLLPGDGRSTQILTVKASDTLGNPLATGGATVAIGLKSGPGRVGSVTDHGDGTYTATLTAPASAGLGVVVATLDGMPVKGGGPDPTEVTVRYTDVMPPRISGPAGSTGISAHLAIPENSLAVHPFTATEPVSWSLNGGRDAAWFSLGAAGELAFSAARDFETPQDSDRDNVYEVVVRATDAVGNAAEQALAITVSDINEAPDGLVLKGASIAENAGPDAVVGVLQGSDPDRNTVFGYRLVSGVPDNARFKIDGNVLRSGQSLDHETQRIHRVKVRVDDGALSLEKELPVVVEDRNDAPVVVSAIGDKVLTLQQAVSWVLPSAIFIDVDAGQSLTYSVSGLPPGILYLPQTKTFTGSPVSVGNFPVQVTATDSGTPPLSATATMQITVDRPSIQTILDPAYLLIGNEDMPVALAVGSSQPVGVYLADGSLLPLDRLEAQGLTGRIVFTGPAVDVQGNPKGSLSVRSGGVWTPVRPSAQAPVVVSVQDFAGGRVAFEPEADEYGLRYATLPYRVDLSTTAGSSVVASATGLIYIAVRNVNDPPKTLPVSAIPLAYEQRMNLNLMDLFTERDPDDLSRLSYSVDSVGADLDASLFGNELRITSWATDPGPVEIRITATDPQGASAQATLQVNQRGRLLQPNAVPTVVIWTVDESKPEGVLPAELVAGNVSIILPENRVLAFAARGSDPDSDPLSYRLTGRDAVRFAVDASGRVIARHGLDFENPVDAGKAGRYQLAVTVSDGRGGEVIQPVEVLVSNQVEAAELKPGKTLNWSIPIDQDGGTRSFSIKEFFSNPEGGGVTAAVVNSGELALLGILTQVNGDRIEVTLPTGYASVANMQLSVEANGLIRVMRVRISADFDSDGIDNFTESFAGDRNRDGVSDSDQDSVASLPAIDSDAGDPASFLSLAATPRENPYTGALRRTLPSGAELQCVLKFTAVELSEVSLAEQELLKGVLGGSSLKNVRIEMGLLRFQINPAVKVLGSVSRVEQASFEAVVRAGFAAHQNVVRIVFPVGVRVNTFVKMTSAGIRYEFLKAPLRSPEGVLRRDPDGNVLYTGAEFLNTDADPEFDEVLLYLVDNERGDDDPLVGSIRDPGVFAFVDRDTEIVTPVIHAIASPTADRRPRISGTAPPGSTVRIRDGSQIIGTTVCNAQGTWTHRPAFDLALGVHLFTAIAYNDDGLVSLPSNDVRIIIQNRVVAATDSFLRIPRQSMKWRVEQILTNDFVSEGVARVLHVDELTTRGGLVRFDGGWITYTPPAGLSDQDVDSFGYDLGNGTEVVRGQVHLVAWDRATGLAQSLVRVLPLARGMQLRFAVIPGRKYRVMGGSLLQSEFAWDSLGEEVADEVGRLELLDPVVDSGARFYRLQLIAP